MSKELDLAKAVLKWWEKAEYEVYTVDEGDDYFEEYYVYNIEPEMVRLAKEILDE